MRTPKNRAFNGTWSILSIVLLLAISNSAFAEGVSLKQCANGGIADAVSHDTCYEWTKGNLNAGKAAYAEGEFVPYRVELTGLTPGASYTYRFAWDTLKGTTHALDYIGTYNASVENANPCAGLTCGEENSHSIPVDDAITEFLQKPGVITLWGGTITYVGPYTSGTLGDTQGISVQFTPTAPNVVMAWAGHIASPLDWGEGSETASDIAGSPYHMRNGALLDGNGVAVAGGNQDMALSAAAVFVPSEVNVTKTANTDGSFSFESWLDGNIPIKPELENDNQWSLGRDQTKTVDAQDRGTVTITEMLPPGDWRVQSITCSKDPDGVIFSYQYQQGQPLQDTASFEVDEASTFNCTFDNYYFGAPVLVVTKRVIGANEDCAPAVRDDPSKASRSIRSGETVKYCYWVTNNGSDGAFDVTLDDNLEGPIALTGGSSIGGDGSIADLAPGGADELTGSTVTTISAPLGTTVTNVATATGTGQVDGQTYQANDSADVVVDQASSCSLTASVFAGEGTCPGSPTAYIVKDSSKDVTWCADVDWDAAAVLQLTEISAELLSTGVSNSGSDMAPGGQQDIAVGLYKPAPPADFNGTLRLSGSEGGINTVSCEGSASLNVVDPGLLLVKLVSENSDCTDAYDQITVINGTGVFYCLSLENTGDVDLENVNIADGLIGLSHDIAVFAAGETLDLPALGPFYWSSDTSNTATAAATEPLTGEPFSDSSTAHVEVLAADIEVSKSVDVSSIVVCDPADAHAFCSGGIGDLFPVTYTITVRNLGPSKTTDGESVVLTDYLPEGFVYGGNDAGCDDITEPGKVICDLGQMLPSDQLVIEIWGDIDPDLFDPPWRTVTNQACARTSPPELDPDPGNDCDTASTTISTGPTRTIGWWGNHPIGIIECLGQSGGVIDLGFLVIRDETIDDVDATVSTDTTAKGKDKSNLMEAILVDDGDSEQASAEVLTKGMLNAGTSHWGDGTQRSRIGQERVKSARQLTAAWCNEATFLSEFDQYFLGWDAIRLIMKGQAYLDGQTVQECGGYCDMPQDLDKVIDSINFIGSMADYFNQSGDHLPGVLPSGSSPGPAEPGAPEDDPTDPTD